MAKHLMNEQARYYQLRFASNALASDAEILERQFLELTDTRQALLCAHEQLQADHTQLRDAYGHLCLAHSDARCELEAIAQAHDEEGALLTEDEGLDLQGEEGFGTDEGALGNKVAESDSTPDYEDPVPSPTPDAQSPSGFRFLQQYKLQLRILKVGLLWN